MAQNTGRGITYPENTDSEQTWVHYTNLANTADAAIGVIQGEVDALAAACPFAVATVTVNLSGSGSASYTAAWTWPAGRFSQPPCTIITNNGGSGSSAFHVQTQSSPTATGGTVLVIHRDGIPTTLTLMVMHIVGIQMTAGSAFG